MSGRLKHSWQNEMKKESLGLGYPLIKKVFIPFLTFDCIVYNSTDYFSPTTMN